MNNYIAMQEINVLKQIVQREEILTSLNKVLNEIKIKPELIEDDTLQRRIFFTYLDMMRANNVEVIEAIVSWRRAFVQPPQFIHNGVNYLLKIVADMGII